MSIARSTFAVAAASILLAGCGGVATSKYTYSETYQPNQPVKGEGCYDAAVVLAKSLADAREIAKKALAAVDSTIQSETDAEIKAQRNRHIGVIVGSGGEELAVGLKPVSAGSSFVTVATKTGFVGGAGQKAWSCEIIDNIVKLAQ